MSSEYLLAVNDLSVHYGRFLAVDRLSCELAAGQLLGLIGPNGAGKTTTLRAVAGLLPITSGSVRVMGVNVHEHPTDAGRHLGLTPDTPQLYDRLTVLRFLDFIGQCYGLSRETRTERIDYWLDALWLQEKRDSKVQALSRGMRQRLAVARTLLSNPTVILLDEPAAGLDPAGRVQFRRLLASLRDQGKAIIVSSHILADLADFCTHIAIMERGRLLSFGTVAEIADGERRERCRYRVTLARPISDAATRLRDVDAASQISVDRDLLILEYDRGRESAAKLLQRLLAVGLPVAEFRAVEPDLEEAYLRSGIEQVD
jgi:ABC-2 type transport system ATP-binding protein